jgi:hypothetical protein
LKGITSPNLVGVITQEHTLVERMYFSARTGAGMFTPAKALGAATLTTTGRWSYTPSQVRDVGATGLIDPTPGRCRAQTADDA